MCESSVYLLKGGEKTMVMEEAARLQVHEGGVVCVSALGERLELADVEIADANLIKHEIVLRPRGQ
jgi:predicted RNA-binding protein